MDNEIRKKLVLDFVRTHQGCTKEHVVEGLKNEVSRVPIFDILTGLLKDSILIDKSANRRDHRLYVNGDNLLVTVPTELEVFEMAYDRLLQSSQEIIYKKDYSSISKRLGIQHSDTSKWDESDVSRYQEFEIESYKNLVKMERRIGAELHRVGRRKEYTAYTQSILDLKHLRHKLSESSHSNSTMKELIRKSELQLSQLETDIKKIEAALYRLPNNIRYHEGFILIEGATMIFYALRDTVFFRSTMIGPNKVQDEETLKKLYSIVYAMLTRIQIKLSKFINSTSIRLVNNPAEYIIGMSKRPNSTLGSRILCYNLTDLYPIVCDIGNILSNMNKEILDLGSRNPLIDEMNSAFGINNDIEKKRNLLEEEITNFGKR